MFYQRSLPDNMNFFQLNNKLKKSLESEELNFCTLFVFFWINLIVPYLIFDLNNNEGTSQFLIRASIGGINLFILGISINKSVFSRYDYLLILAAIIINVPMLSLTAWSLNEYELQWSIHLFVSLFFLLIIIGFEVFLITLVVGLLLAFSLCFVIKKGVLFENISLSKELFYFSFYLLFFALFFIKKKSDKIKEKIKLLRIFSNAIAHELCTPLVSIRLYNNAIEKMPLKKFKSEVGLLVNKSLKFIEVLSYGLHKSSSNSFSIKDLYLNFVSSGFLEGIKKDLIKCTIVDDFQVNIDPIFLFFVLNNLVKNSLKHAKKGDGLIVNIHIKVLKGQKLITYEDNGEGISERNMKKVFDIFSTSKKYNMGLGLPFSRAIMNYFGGSMYCDNAKVGKLKFILVFR